MLNDKGKGGDGTGNCHLFFLLLHCKSLWAGVGRKGIERTTPISLLPSRALVKEVTTSFR